MRNRSLAAIFLMVALLAPATTFAQRKTGRATGGPQAAAPLPPINVTEFKLKNGLRVILHEDHSTPIVGVNLWYHVGSKNEVPGKTGFAHLFEHMMFQGSKNYDDDYFKPIQEAGGTLNGSTNPDRTNYFEVVPSNFFELALFIERAFAGWQKADVPSVEIPDAQGREHAGIYIVDRPGSAQSVINIGQVGVARSTPDYFPLLVLNTMLGGQFVSRVNLNLREDKGYTYGARTSFDYRRGAGPFSASAGVFTKVTKESVAEFMKELRGVRGEIPISEKELEFFKQAIIPGYPRGFETPGQIANRLSNVVLYSLPDDYFNNYIQRVRAVTLADVQRLANRYLDPARMAILVVGDRKVIEPGLRSLEAVGATITFVDMEGKPVTARSGSEGESRQ